MLESVRVGWASGLSMLVQACLRLHETLLPLRLQSQWPLPRTVPPSPCHQLHLPEASSGSNPYRCSGRSS